MSAPIGNKHAERWTRERTIEYLDKIEQLMDVYDFIFLGDVLVHVRLYRDIWAYWREKWEDDYDIYDRMMLIDQRFENRLLKAAMFKEVHAGVATFVLKCQYGYAVPKPAKETQQQETAKATTKPVVITEVSSQTVHSHSSESTNDAETDIGYHATVPVADTGS